jgi:hypothetical protein
MHTTESKLGAISLILLFVVAVGCKPEETAPTSVTPAAAPAPAAVSIGDAAAPVAPPPGSAPGAPTAAAPAAIDIAQVERSVNAQGLAMSDLEFLNHLVHEVNESRISDVSIPDRAFKTEAEQMAYEEAMQQRKAPVKDLNELVTAGVIKALPEAPAGQHYVIDPTSGKVVLQ